MRIKGYRNMQRASIVVLVVGVLLGLMLVRAADGRTIHSLQLQPDPPAADQPVTLTVDLTFEVGGHELFTGPLPPAPGDGRSHRLDVIYWRDALTFSPAMLTRRTDTIALGAFPVGVHDLTVFLHDLTSDAATREALLADPVGFAGPGDDPFAAYNVTQRTLTFEVGRGTSAPEPGAATGWMLIGALAWLRRRAGRG